MKKVILYTMVSFLLISQTACFGSFDLIKKVYDWNDSLSSNKFVKSIIMWAMFIVPVYEIAGFLDLVIFNLIEFWTGSNPVAMNEGEIETQLVSIKGEDYKITATKNQFQFEKLTEEGTSEIAIMKYDEQTQVWSYIKGTESIDLIKIGDEELTYFTKEGDVKVSMSTVLAATNSDLALN